MMMRFLLDQNKFLAAPPSTAESERVFSTMAEIYSSKRSSLSEEHGKMQLFLHHNFDDTD
jgi:hypothetical protein